MKYVFIINGSGGTGKDTFCNCVANLTKTKVVSSIDIVKERALMLGWDGVKDEKGRKFLSDLKNALTDYNDEPFKYMKRWVNIIDDNMFCFLHIREPEEIERAKKEFNAKTILVKRPSVKQITSNMADANVFNYDYDIIINNDETLEELNDKAYFFVEDVKSNKLRKEY